MWPKKAPQSIWDSVSLFLPDVCSIQLHIDTCGNKALDMVASPNWDVL